MNYTYQEIYYLDFDGILDEETISNRLKQAEGAMHSALIKSFRVRSTGALQYPGARPEVLLSIEVKLH